MPDATGSDELTWMPAWEIRERIVKGDVSPVEVTEHFLGRIEEFDATLKTFRTLDAEGARRQAKQAEEKVRRGDLLGPMHGVPFSVKEHVAVAGMPLMGAGFPEPISKRDALGVQRLRDAGGIVFGTNTMMYTPRRLGRISFLVSCRRRTSSRQGVPDPHGLRHKSGSTPSTVAGATTTSSAWSCGTTTSC